MFARVKTFCYLGHVFNGICFNEEPWLTSFSTALDLAFGVWEVTQHAYALGCGSASCQQDQRRMVEYGT